MWVVFCNRDASGFGQIFASRSIDSGQTFSAPVRVTDGTHNSAYPEVAVTANGTIGVLYVDFDDSGAQTVYTHRFARSTNNGVYLDARGPAVVQDPGALQRHARISVGRLRGSDRAGEHVLRRVHGEEHRAGLVQFDPIFFRMPG